MSAESIELPPIYMIHDADRDLQRIAQLRRQRETTKQWLEQQLGAIDHEIHEREASLYAFAVTARKVTGKAVVPLASGEVKIIKSRERIEKTERWQEWAKANLKGEVFWKTSLKEQEAMNRVKWGDDGKAYDTATGEEIPGIVKVAPERPFSLSYTHKE